MQCPGCQHQIPWDSLLCRICGAWLQHRCPSCGTSVSLPARVCRVCLRPLGPGVVTSVARPSQGSHTLDGASPPGLEAAGGRRQLTVMFCDLVRSSRLGERLDPEDLWDVIGSFHETCEGIVERFQGRLHQYLGDGVLTYFSYPHAHEDDPERAVRAGLSIVSELERVNQRLESEQGVRLGVRIGIHTGDVVMGETGSGKDRAIVAWGHTVNLADRLQKATEPGSVAISGETARLVHGLFVMRDLGALSLEGIAEPVPAYCVLRAGRTRHRLDVAAAAGLTPLVGREKELRALLDRWDRASKGRGHVVLLRGEAGIGKSRLVYALRDQLADWSHTWLECRGSPYHENSAFYPVIELLCGELGLSSEEPGEEQSARIQRALERAGPPLSGAAPLLTALLSLPPPEGCEPLALSPEGRRRKTLEALVGWLDALARRRPTVLVFEDLHWTDSSSMELLGMLIERAETAPLLVLATFRPSFEPPWPDRSWMTRVKVDPLRRDETRRMVEEMIGGRALPAALLDQVVEKTDGVPLFIEELTKSLLESVPLAPGDGGDAEGVSPAELAIPSTLQDSLAARLDRLGPAKDVAQRAAVLGREFSLELLGKVFPEFAPTLEERLAELANAELVYPSADPPGGSYTFKHALIQEAAYQSLLRSTRRAWHERIVRVLEDQFPMRVESEPEEMARHCEAAGLIEKAISYRQVAAEVATKRCENAEAVGHLTRGIELVGRLPECPERDEIELSLREVLGEPLVAVKGWGSEETRRAYARARELCEAAGEPTRLFRVIRRLLTYYVARADLEAAHDLANRMLQLSEGQPDSSLPLVANQQMAILLYFKGELPRALEHFERAFGLYEPAQHRSLTELYGEDIAVFIRIWMAWNLWLLGSPDRAWDVSREGIELGSQAGHPFSHANALLWSSVLGVMRREREQARKLAEEAIAISAEQGFAFLLAGARLIRGWTLIDPRDEDEQEARAIDGFRKEMVNLAAGGTQICAPIIIGYLADAYCDRGRIPEGLTAVDDALRLSRSTQQRVWDAELHRIKGKLMLQESGEAEGQAERLFQQALGVARAQQARSLELRAAMSLCRLWQRRGAADQARGLLAPVYARFTEGFETADLREAKELLDELS